MGYEIDFLAVGESKKSGDEIAIRIGDLYSANRDDHFVAIIDGGFSKTGSLVVDHVRNVYGTDRVDLVISSHLDDDHIAGLTTVITELDVGALWMHEPSAGDEAGLAAAVREARSDASRSRLVTITASIEQSRTLAELARDLDIAISAPFAGQSAAEGALTVIGPTAQYYEDLLPRFRNYQQLESLRSMVASGLEQKMGAQPLTETLEDEKLEEGATTGPENNSSVITLIAVDGRATILAADAGEEALQRAADYLDEAGFDWTSLRAVQVPHHGSKNNVTPSILNRYLGDKVQTNLNKFAYVSCAPEGEPHHPAKRVTNAFHRRGCRVYKTAGSTVRHSENAPKRDGYDSATAVPFYTQVD